MSRFPRGDEILAAHEDQLEALTRLFHGRAAAMADPRSRFHGLTDADVQGRLEEDREELDRWALMMLVASFEATVRTDAEARVQQRTKDALRKPLRDLYQKYEGRVRLDDILSLWEYGVGMAGTVKINVRTLLKHRHWLAHGRHWTNKHGALPRPPDAGAYISDYVQWLQAVAPDFPRA